jgi:purine-nucleoside/S-methyl-5'-thioadenosine phosphorylase / adenosine deaminase
MTDDSAVTAGPALLREEPVADAAVPRFALRAWEARYGVTAGVTTRGHGFSLGLWSEESVGQVMTRWRAFRTAFGTRFPALVLSHQVHGTVTAWHERRADGWLIQDGVDGHACATPGVLLTVTLADCIPVYLVVPAKGAVALLHAGWRGAAAGILERGVALLKRHAFARAADIVMHCGVGICGACYEVGPEVASQFVARPDTGPQRLDLRDQLARQARALGIGAVTCSPWCSAHDDDRFFSHRASGGRDGRMVAYLGQPLA